MIDIGKRFRIQTEFVQNLAKALESKGHSTRVIDTQLNSVDGIYVGCWLMPVKNSFTARIGFSNALEEFPRAISASIDQLTTWVMNWLSLHGEMSRKRSEVNESSAGDFEGGESVLG